VQKTSKVIWPVTFGTVSALIARKNTGAYYISALSCRTAPLWAQQCWKQDQKYKTKSQDQDRGRSETGIWPSGFLCCRSDGLELTTNRVS